MGMLERSYCDDLVAYNNNNSLFERILQKEKEAKGKRMSKAERGALGLEESGGSGDGTDSDDEDVSQEETDGRQWLD